MTHGRCARATSGCASLALLGPGCLSMIGANPCNDMVEVKIWAPFWGFCAASANRKSAGVVTGDRAVWRD